LEKGWISGRKQGESGSFCKTGNVFSLSMARLVPPAVYQAGVTAHCALKGDRKRRVPYSLRVSTFSASIE
jgi:hypothetical protein